MTETTHETRGASSAAPLTETQRYRALADPQRLATVRTIEGREGQLSLERLASAVAAGLDGEPDPEFHDRFRCRLHHVHLPLLADLGVLAYDTATNQVEPDPTVLACLLP